MHMLIRFICLWGLADAIWLGTTPKSWGKFWQLGVEKIATGTKLPRAMSVLQIMICLWMFLQTARKK